MDRILRRFAAKYREVRRTPTRIMISVFKAALAYMILVIMAMSNRVRSGFSFPIVLTAATVVVVAGYPGANIGQCIGASTFGLIGVGLGAVAFVILAKLAHAPVAQGLVFVIIVYLFSLLKAKSMKFFGTALLGILVSFAGIYTSLSLPGKPFSADYLEDYLKSYTMGGAIVLAVNLLVFPISAEKELRRTLVTSLGHIRTFAHLLAKSYAITITEEERDVRDGLSQSIRADFGILQQKLGSTTLEINYSNFSMDDYRRMIDWTNRLQQDLIGTYSTVLASETAWRDPDQHLFRKEFLPSTQASFLVLRKEMSQAIREICRVLGDGISVEELLEYEEYRGSDTPERKAEDGHGRPLDDHDEKQNTSQKHEDLVKRLMDGGMRRRLDAEIGVAPTPAHGRSPAVSRRQSMHDLVRPKQGDTLHPTNTPGTTSGQATPRGTGDLDGSTNVASSSGAPSTAFPSMSATATRVSTSNVSPLVMGHYRFRDSQQEVLAHLLCSGEMHAADATLRLDAKQPAMTERFTAQAEREAKKEVELKNRKKGRIPPSPKDEELLKEREKKKELDACDPESSQGRLLLAVTSFMFLMGQFTRDLDGLHKFVVGEIGLRKKKRLHVHVFESPKRAASASEALSGSSTSYVSGPSGPSLSNLKPDPSNGRASSTTTNTTAAGNAEAKVNKDKQKKANRKYHIPMNEALAILEGRTPVYPKKKTPFQRFVELESVLRSDASIIALKTAAAAIAYTAIILAPSSRSFFIQYSLTGGVLSVVVAMSPSLGQTLFTFVNQIIGTVVGNIYGMTLLYIFRDVGGYKYNPYGIVCMLIPFSLVMAYLIYTKPPYLPLGLLALNGANLTIFTLIIYEDTPTFTDSPALRAGKAMTAMCIGLSIAFAFQFMILRSPARRLLRQAVADLMSSMTAYYILHAAFISALNPDTESMTGERAPLSILNEVSHDLARRERVIQGQLIGIYPLLNFAKLEPDFGSGGFRGDVYKRIITSSQLFMDRLREARVIITTLNDDNIDVDAHQDPSVFFSIPSFGPIAAYRRLHNRLNKHRLYMLTTALQSKTPLPQDSLATRFVPTGIVQHDILVLTQRLTKEPGGHDIIRSSAFLRLLSYMLAVGQWRHHVNAIEEAVGDLLGVWEDDQFL